MESIKKIENNTEDFKISFVIPAYNEEAYIGKCLEAIQKELQETNSEGEVIVVNNGSTDKTKEIALGFPGVRVLDEAQKGTSRARNSGYLSSTGNIIANVDADTIIPPGWIIKVKKAFSNDKGLVAISGPYYYYDTSFFINAQVFLFYLLGYCLYFLNRFVFRAGSMIQGANVAIRKSALEKIGGYDVRFTFYGDDTDLARRLHKVGGVRFTFKLFTYSSGRRLSKEGVIKMGITYTLNYFWPMFFKRPFTKSAPDIRASK